MVTALPGGDDWNVSQMIADCQEMSLALEPIPDHAARTTWLCRSFSGQSRANHGRKRAPVPGSGRFPITSSSQSGQVSPRGRLQSATLVGFAGNSSLSEVLVLRAHSHREKVLYAFESSPASLDWLGLPRLPRRRRLPGTGCGPRCRSAPIDTHDDDRGFDLGLTVSWASPGFSGSGAATLGT